MQRRGERERGRVAAAGGGGGELSPREPSGGGGGGGARDPALPPSLRPWILPTQELLLNLLNAD